MHSELRRKLIHSLGIVFIPFLYFFPTAAVIACCSLIPIYLGEEYAHRHGRSLGGFIPWLQRCKRIEETNTWVWDPIFLCLGLSLAMILFPFPAAAVGIWQATLADSAAALVGLHWGRHQLPWSRRKTWAGTLTFFLVALIGSLGCVDLKTAPIVALVGTACEQEPWQGVGNLLIPLGVGGVMTLLS